MNSLSKVLIFKIIGTVFLWCVPLLLFPASILELIGLPESENTMFLRLLGWAYLSLCLGYFFSLQASLRGQRLMGPIWVGLLSNGGACLYLLYFGLTGYWSQWGGTIQFVAWGSFIATALITIGLYIFGVKGQEPIVSSV